MSEFSPDQKPVRGEDDLWPLARRIAQKTLEVWESRIRRGPDAVAGSHLDSLQAIFRAEIRPEGCSVPEHLARLLEDDNSSVQKGAIKALDRIRSSDPEVSKALVSRIRDESDYDHRREAAIEVLGKIGSSDKVALDALTELLEGNEGPGLREEAAKALGQIGSSDRSVVNALLARFGDEDPAVRQAAVKAVGQIGTTDPDAHEAIIDQLESDESPLVRRTAAEALTEIGHPNESVFEGLVGRLEDDESGSVRRVAAESLVEFSRSAPETVLDVFSERLADLSQTDIEELENVFGSKGAVVYALAEQVEGSAPSLRRKSEVKALGGLVDEGIVDEATAVETFVDQLTSDRSLHLRKAAIRELVKIAPPDETVVGALIEQFRDNLSVAWVAAEALSRIGRSDPELVIRMLLAREPRNPLSKKVVSKVVRFNPTAAEVLQGWLNHDDRWARQTVVNALGNAGCPDSEVIAALIGRLDDEHQSVRRAAARALGRLGHPASEAVTALVELLGDDESVRSAAIEALGSIGGSEKKVVEALVHSCKRGLRSNSIEAIWRLSWHIFPAEHAAKVQSDLVEAPEKMVVEARFGKTHAEPTGLFTYLIKHVFPMDQSFFPDQEGKRYLAVHWKELARLPE